MMRSRANALALAALLTAGCGNKAAPTPSKDPVPTASAAIPSAAASAVAPVRQVPRLVLEKFAPGGVHPTFLYPVDGALMVTEGLRVGRIDGDDVKWVGEVPKSEVPERETQLRGVYGHWPDTVVALYESGIARAPMPTLVPLTWKAPEKNLGETPAWMLGVFRLGETTLMALERVGGDGIEISTLRGPPVIRKLMSEKEGGCKPGEIWKRSPDVVSPAVTGRAYQSTEKGTLVSIGRLCQNREPAAEIWDEKGKSRLVDLGRFWKKIESFPKLLRGIGDELFAYSDMWSRILRYHDGDFEALPDLERPIKHIFTAAGKLHVYDGQTIHAYEGGKWTPAGRLALPKYLYGMEGDEKGRFWVSSSGVHRVREATATDAPDPPDAFEETCKQWFVFLYQVSDKSEPNFTFPATRKALATFPEVADLQLIDLKEEIYRRYLGVIVKSKAQGEAVVAHVKANMTDEDPRLLCYAPPKSARVVDMNTKGK